MGMLTVSHAADLITCGFGTEVRVVDSHGLLWYDGPPPDLVTEHLHAHGFNRGSTGQVLVSTDDCVPVVQELSLIRWLRAATVAAGVLAAVRDGLDLTSDSLVLFRSPQDDGGRLFDALMSRDYRGDSGAEPDVAVTLLTDIIGDEPGTIPRIVEALDALRSNPAFLDVQQHLLV